VRQNKSQMNSEKTVLIPRGRTDFGKLEVMYKKG
jgi:hypothetical protein